MRRIGYALIALFVLGMIAFPLVGCSGSRLNPGVEAALGWRDTPEVTGPAIDVGLGTYELGDAPFGSPDGQATPAPAPQADPALVQALKDLEAKQAEAAERLKTLDAQVASGALTPEQAKAIQDATASGDLSATAAREAADKVAALEAKLAELEGQAAPGWLPKDLSIPGLVTFALGWGAWLLRKKGITALRDQIARAKAEAMAQTTKAIKAFDDLPDAANAAEVQLATAPPPVLASNGNAIVV